MRLRRTKTHFKRDQGGGKRPPMQSSKGSDVPGLKKMRRVSRERKGVDVRGERTSALLGEDASRKKG